MNAKKILWIIPEKKGGIRWYGDALTSALRKQIKNSNGDFEILDPIYFYEDAITKLRDLNPDVIHIQHEFGVFGSKVPGLYRFPKWISQVRSAFPKSRIVATAHTVLDKNYKYPIAGRGWQTPLRWLVNQFALPFFRPFWTERTWGILDGVVVHSPHLVNTIRESGCPTAKSIPLFVSPSPQVDLETPRQKKLLVLGYFSPEKGQDIAIQALAHLTADTQLILAGGLRRNADRPYFEKCKRLINELNLSDQVSITGYVDRDQFDQLYEEAALVIAPFRESSGSGSLSHALAHGTAILASDILINQEYESLVKGCLAFFKSEDSKDCAHQIQLLLKNSPKLIALRKAARDYAEAWNPDQVAKSYLEFYDTIENPKTL